MSEETSRTYAVLSKVGGRARDLTAPRAVRAGWTEAVGLQEGPTAEAVTFGKGGEDTVAALSGPVALLG